MRIAAIWDLLRLALQIVWLVLATRDGVLNLMSEHIAPMFRIRILRLMHMLH